MRTARWAMSLVTVAAVTALGCGGGGTDLGNGNGNGNGNGQPPPPPPPSADVVVEIENTAFVDPSGRRNASSVVTIQLGETVGWVNNDAIAHTATSTSEPEDGNPFNIDMDNQGDRGTFTPNVAGTWVYFCEVHPGIMREARIVVEE